MKTNTLAVYFTHKYGNNSVIRHLKMFHCLMMAASTHQLFRFLSQLLKVFLHLIISWCYVARL